MKSQNEAGFSINDEPDVVLDSFDFDNSFVCMPLVGIEVQQRYKLKGDAVKQRRELFAPIADGGMGYFDTISNTQDHGDVSERVLADIEHGERHKNGLHRIAHPGKIHLA